MSIICLGSVNIDDVYKVEHIVRNGETIASSSFERHPGGKGANQSVALAKAGGKVYHIGAIGKDGVWVKDLMKSYGVLVDNLTITADPTGKAIIQVSDEGENAIVLLPGANHCISLDSVSKGISSVQNAKWMLCQGEMKSNITSAAIKHAKSNGLLVCLNPAPMSSTITKDLDFNLIDLLIVNEVEFGELFEQLGCVQHSNRKEDIKELLTKLPDLAICVLTLGSKGGVLGFRLSGSISIASLDGVEVNNVVDTTGAGDTFTGFFLASLALLDLKKLDNDTISKVFNLANSADGLSCTIKGAMNSIPKLNEVVRFANNVK